MNSYVIVFECINHNDIDPRHFHALKEMIFLYRFYLDGSP